MGVCLFVCLVVGCKIINKIKVLCSFINKYSYLLREWLHLEEGGCIAPPCICCSPERGSTSGLQQ